MADHMPDVFALERLGAIGAPPDRLFLVRVLVRANFASDAPTACARIDAAAMAAHACPAADAADIISQRRLFFFASDAKLLAGIRDLAARAGVTLPASDATCIAAVRSIGRPLAREDLVAPACPTPTCVACAHLRS